MVNENNKNRELMIEEKLTGVENAVLISLMHQVAYGFVMEPSVFPGTDPFLPLDEQAQDIALNNLKNRIGPTLGEL
jgi:hypothetical protein